MTDSAAIDEMAEGMTFGVDDGFGDKFDDGLGHETGNGAVWPHYIAFLTGRC